MVASEKDEPLRATYTPSRPPWIGYWNKRWDRRDQFAFH